MAAIYSNQDDIDTNVIEFFIIVVILVSVFIHQTSDWLYVALQNRRYFIRILERFYRELMILGVISLVLFMVSSAAGSDLAINTKHALELVHYSLLIVFFGHLAITLFWMRLSVRISRHWDQLERQDFTAYQDIKRKHELLQVKQKYQSPIANKLVALCYCGRNKIEDQVAFHDLRLHFIHSNRLPRNFSFAAYLRGFACLLIVDVLMRGVSKRTVQIDLGYRVPVVLLAFILIFGTISIYNKLRFILNKILHSDIIDFDPYAARYYIKRVRKISTLKDTMKVARTRIFTSEKNAFSPEGDGAARRNTRSISKSAITQLSTYYNVSEWGKPPRKRMHSLDGMKEPHIDLELDEKYEENESSGKGLTFEQETLFWFGNHVYTLYCIQVAIVLLIFYTAILIASPVEFFSFDSLVDVLVTLILIIPFPIILLLVPVIIPTYVIIINVGQLVDVDIVQRVKDTVVEKASSVRSATEQSGSDAALLSVTFTPAFVKSGLARVLPSPMYVELTKWIAILHSVALIVMYGLDLPREDEIIITVICIAVSTFYMCEFAVKFWLLGKILFLKDSRTKAEMVLFTAAFIASLVSLAYPIQWTTIVLMIRVMNRPQTFVEQTLKNGSAENRTDEQEMGSISIGTSVNENDNVKIVVDEVNLTENVPAVDEKVKGVPESQTDVTPASSRNDIEIISPINSSVDQLVISEENDDEKSKPNDTN